MLFASSTLPIALAISSLAGVSSGHSHALPGSIEFHRRANFHKVARRSLASCHEELSERGGVYERAIERRRISAARYRQKRGLRESGSIFLLEVGLDMFHSCHRSLQTRCR
jgi:hypothetical protein